MKATDIKPGTIYAIAPANSINDATAMLVIDNTTPAHFLDGILGDHKLHRTHDNVHAGQREYVGISGSIEALTEHLPRLQGLTVDSLIGKQRTPSLLPRNRFGHAAVAVATFRLRDVRTTWADYAAEQDAIKTAREAQLDGSRRHDARQRERFELLKAAAIAKGIPAEGIEQALVAHGTSQSMGNSVEVSQDTLAILLGVELPDRVES